MCSACVILRCQKTTDQSNEGKNTAACENDQILFLDSNRQFRTVFPDGNVLLNLSISTNGRLEEKQGALSYSKREKNCWREKPWCGASTVARLCQDQRNWFCQEPTQQNGVPPSNKHPLKGECAHSFRCAQNSSQSLFLDVSCCAFCLTFGFPCLFMFVILGRFWDASGKELHWISVKSSRTEKIFTELLSNSRTKMFGDKWMK